MQKIVISMKSGQSEYIEFVSDLCDHAMPKYGHCYLPH